MTIVSFLLIGWILSWFKFEQLFIQAFQELFNKTITKASYYFIFFLYRIDRRYCAAIEWDFS